MNPLLLMSLLSAGGGLLSSLGGQNGQFGSTYTENQRNTIDDLLQSVKGMRGQQDITQNPSYQQGQDYLMSLFNDPEFFNRFEAPLQRQFNEQTVPGLANRFASMGSGGSLGSTGFRNQLAREGSNLSTNIAALRGNMQQQAVPQLLGYAQQPFQNLMQLYNTALTPTRNVYQPPSAGPFAPIFSAISGGLAQGYGQKIGQGMA